LTSSWLTLEEIDALYSIADWDPILRGSKTKWVDNEGRFGVLSMFKAFALPFLIPISSEHALARELSDRLPLRSVCGFSQHGVPTRAMFWHFRHHNSGVFQENMPKVLVILALAGDQLQASLPFVGKSLAVSRPVAEPSLSFHVSRKLSRASVWKGVGRTKQPMLLNGEEQSDHSDSSGTIGMFNGLGFPFLAEVKDDGKSSVFFTLDKPEWLDYRKPLSDPLTMVGSSMRQTPYVATHAILCRGHGEQRRVLMGISDSGSAKGTYTLPGGTLMPEETIKDCIAREVAEETGLRVENSRPVSFFFTSFKGKPCVLNIVAWVNQYSGKLQNCEPMNFLEWVWILLDDIPNRLIVDVFPPALISIRHFRNLRYGRLRWDTFEEDVAGRQLGQAESVVPGGLPLPLWGEPLEEWKSQISGIYSCRPTRLKSSRDGSAKAA